MNRLAQRLAELEVKLEAGRQKLDKLDSHHEAMGGFVDGRKIALERKVVLRELTDLKIRIRNLQKSKKNEDVGEERKCTNNLNKKANASADCSDFLNEIDSKDAEFDPEAVPFSHVRSAQRVYPKIALPHAQPVWKRLVRVGRREMQLTEIRNASAVGQFGEIEEDQEETPGQSKKRNYLNEDEGKLLLSGQTSPYSDNKSSTSCLETPIFSQTDEFYQISVASVPVNLGSTVQAASSTNITLLPRIDRTFSTLTLTPPLNLSSEQTIHIQSCICHRPLRLVTCSSQSCGHSFWGRVAIPCPAHPTDHYLMDHPTICPICKAVPLVEHRKAHFAASPEQNFTKLRSKYGGSSLNNHPGARPVMKDELFDMNTAQLQAVVDKVDVSAGGEMKYRSVLPSSTVPRLVRAAVRVGDISSAAATGLVQSPGRNRVGRRLVS